MLTEFVIGLVLPIIQQIGYAGVFVLMTAESTLLPVPSEAVLPFVGWLVAQGNLNFWISLIVATIGTIVGASISYLIGKYVGQAVIAKWGKYILIREEELENSKKWFKKHGEKTIFICRFIPAIRHVISLPAGAADMHFKKFILYTAAGGAIWNAILLIVGMQLKENWNMIIQYSSVIDIIVIAVIVIVLAWFFLGQMKKTRWHKKRNSLPR